MEPLVLPILPRPHPSLLPLREKVARQGRMRGQPNMHAHLFESLPSIWFSTKYAASSTFVPGPKISATPAARKNA
jgi:hypothetical protein